MKTIDESEIRRLADKADREWWEACAQPGGYKRCLSAVIADAIRTALAAEREQHARDVHLAFIEGRDSAIDNAAMKAYDMGRPDIREAINALVPNLHAHTTCAGCPPPSPASPTAPDLPPEMLAVLRDPSVPLHGEGDAANLVLARGCKPCLRAEHPYWHPAGTPCPLPATTISALPPTPASPTRETRDESPAAGCFSHSDAAKCYPGCCGQGPGAPPFVSSAPASAPGGAPGVETCGAEHPRAEFLRCTRPRGHMDRHRDGRGPGYGATWWDGGTGTTPTPSTETPTGER